MASSKATVIEELSTVKNLGVTYATAAYDDLGVRSISDLIAAAREGKLQTIKGIGPAKEKSILKSAEELSAAPSPAPEASKPKSPTKKDAPKKAEAAKKEAPKKADAAKKEAPKQAAPKAGRDDGKDSKAAAKSEPESKKPADKPRTTYRPPQPKARPTLPGLVFKLAKKIIGRLLS